MGETVEMQNVEGQETIDQGGDHNGDHSEYETLVEELRKLRELEGLKRFLQVENLKLKTQVDTLTGELEGISVSMSAVKATMDSYELERRKCEKKEVKLKPRKDFLMREINDLHLKIKASKEDDATCSSLTDALGDDLADIKAQRKVAIKRLNDMRAGIKRIDNNKKLRMPRLREYDSVLKQMCTAFRESQNLMEVSLMMKEK